ncbi:2-keto-4-pentenoate hydratase/2-oxohepta-3-ene-1,7-dioic acid hydratase in catechol pathway [Breoghania corrubedonensis]|uniref:2-keto-4-pentenoate hydratase/2-oxohepta-3-ene-1,7-dioic acid hydratase in catechol pathway n=1 Tax=Breoghania corrubedonensis TaxID=665038 RepID=A0A2T5V4N4_9HYPH|nr:fumarylacetoacetate hydrolase family protein [Breoghania corrubedonensis]PTW58727.1 2-keto-4-pentenoate hydratase/2-oxohepta-3-ene-1,7-dioic acid hydratase in catechol pathway [Breoghania corrubedonensis]
MKLVRFGPAGAEKPGLIEPNGTVRDLSAHAADFAAETVSLEAISRLRDIDPESLPAVAAGTRLGAPLARVGHFLAIGLNYADHAAEAGMPIPAEPIIFSKAPSCLSGPDDDVVLPKGSQKADWEVELAVVIGKRMWQVSQADALAHVSGYAVANDVSERKWQIEGTGQWIKGKSAPTFGPLGPWLVTADEIADPQALDMFLDLNGTRMQTGNTATMIFSVAQCLSFLSTMMVLEPGDVVVTGTPPGVGMGKKPQVFLKAGDEMRLGIEGLGEQRQKVVAE